MIQPSLEEREKRATTGTRAGTGGWGWRGKARPRWATANEKRTTAERHRRPSRAACCRRRRGSSRRKSARFFCWACDEKGARRSRSSAFQHAQVEVRQPLAGGRRHLSDARVTRLTCTSAKSSLISMSARNVWNVLIQWTEEVLRNWRQVAVETLGLHADTSDCTDLAIWPTVWPAVAALSAFSASALLSACIYCRLRRRSHQKKWSPQRAQVSSSTKVPFKRITQAGKEGGEEEDLSAARFADILFHRLIREQGDCGRKARAALQKSWVKAANAVFRVIIDIAEG